MKNFNVNGFTEYGLINYAFLRNKGIDKEKAISILIKEDKENKEAIKFKERWK